MFVPIQPLLQRGIGPAKCNDDFFQSGILVTKGEIAIDQASLAMG